MEFILILERNTDICRLDFYMLDLACKDIRRWLDDNTVPILFIHGADDNFILPKNSEDMAKRTKGMSEVYLIPGAEHAVSILTDKDSYQKCVSGFLSKLQ